MGGSVVKSKKRRRQPPLAHRVETVLELPGGTLSGEARIDAATGVLTPVRVGTVSVIAAKAGNDEFNDAASAPFVLTITLATPAGAPQYTRITKDGKTPALTLAGSSLQPSCTIRAAGRTEAFFCVHWLATANFHLALPPDAVQQAGAAANRPA